MRKKSKRIFQIILITILMLMVSTTVLAAGDVYEPGDLEGTLTFGESTKIRDVGNQIIGIIQAIGTVVSVAVLIILGIKYMMGSVDEKANYKKSLMPYVIGAGILLAASTISYIIMNVIKF